jgi:hypothetical protein
MPVNLSKTSKLDGIKSWSLQARDTCPGSFSAPGVLVDACKGCYATQGNYRFDNVKTPREANRLDWQRLDWTDDMVHALDDSRYFRWFDSGDMFALPLAEKILEIMQRTPWCNHWLPTRMHKFPKFRQVLEAMQALPNVMVRPSSDSVLGEFLPGTHGSVIVPTAEDLPKGAKLCQAYENGGKCNGCRSCWSKDVPVVAYLAHGRTMAKVVRIALAA